MTLWEYTRRLIARQSEPRLSEEDSFARIQLLTAAALKARRAGVVPTLADLAASPEEEAAWVLSLEQLQERQAWEAKGANSESEALGKALENLSRNLRTQVLGWEG